VWKLWSLSFQPRWFHPIWSSNEKVMGVTFLVSGWPAPRPAWPAPRPGASAGQPASWPARPAPRPPAVSGLYPASRPARPAPRPASLCRRDTRLAGLPALHNGHFLVEPF
jgi:hypothetical protein